MTSRWGAKVALLAGAGAIVAMGTMTACGSDSAKTSDTKAPETGASQSPASMAPSEKKQIGSFAPTVTADRAPTRVPGNQGKLAP